MASTFDNNLRLAEMATGDQDGTWGTQTNTNLSLITDAFKYGSEAIPDASTATITMANATADDARSFYLKCTGGGQACTVTLAPNTVSKVWIIENATSYTLTFSQGSGANVAVAAGATKMIVTDGGGSSAAVYDALEDLNLGGTPTMTNLTVTSSVTADAVTAPTLTGSTSVKTPLIEFTDGDNAIAIADGGGVEIATSLDMNGKELILDADADTSITADVDDQIDFKVGGTDQIQLNDGYLAPVTNNDIDLGTSSLQFKDGYFDGTLTTDVISNSGSITSGTYFYSSDAALKEDIQTIENPLEKVQALRGVSYKWKDTGRKDIGLVADEVQEVLPELVVENEHKQMDYGHMIGLLVEAIKEQQKEIEELKCQK